MSSVTLEKEQVGSDYAAESQSEGFSSPGEAQPLQHRQRKSKKTTSTKERQQSQSGPLSNVGGLDNLPTGDLTYQASGAVSGVTKTLGIAAAVEDSLNQIRPICKRITNKVDKAEKTPKDELDEEELVKEIRPLLEDGNKILSEANGIIRGMDPDGRIQRNAKHKSASRNASPEEQHLAEVHKELTVTVTECIDNGKRKVEGMPHAKKLNPLWGLLAEPLGQILATVGLLLSGVLGLVGRFLSGLGLGGLVDGLLSSLGSKNILGGLGLGDALGSLTGKK